MSFYHPEQLQVCAPLRQSRSPQGWHLGPQQPSTLVRPLGIHRWRNRFSPSRCPTILFVCHVIGAWPVTWFFAAAVLPNIGPTIWLRMCLFFNPTNPKGLTFELWKNTIDPILVACKGGWFVKSSLHSTFWRAQMWQLSYHGGVGSGLHHYHLSDDHRCGFNPRCLYSFHLEKRKFTCLVRSFMLNDIHVIWLCHGVSKILKKGSCTKKPLVHYHVVGDFYKWGYPQMDGLWKIQENPIKMDENWGYHHDLGNPQL